MKSEAHTDRREFGKVAIGALGGAALLATASKSSATVHTIQPGIKLQDDSIASIKTKGLIGERYVRISPGGSDKIIGPNGRIREVEPPVDIEELLSKYIFGKV
jgi:phospholipid/cholesterol/gamma-HCH transport system substrate-binding protein